MKTSCTISFGENEFAIRNDANFNVISGALQSFCDFEDISQGKSVTKPYATHETKYWLLDGNYKIMPSTNAHVGIMGNTLSTSPSGNFETLINIEINFDTVHSTNGLNFIFSFSDDWMDEINVRFYNSSFALIRDDLYTPTGTTFSTNQPVANFKRMHILLNSTNKRYRYPRINRIDFDTLTRFTGTEIKSANVVEQINPLSIELPSNTLEFKLFSDKGDFNIVNPQGFYANLQYKKPIDVHEDINGDTVYIGRFYLDKWESLSENLATFEASDAINIMNTIDYFPRGSDAAGVDPISYYLGGVTHSIYSESLIYDIFSTVNVIYDLDISLEGMEISPGSPTNKTWLPITTCRNCLQLLLFRMGGVAISARSSHIVIKPFVLASNLTSFDFHLTNTEKGLGSNLTLKNLVTDIELISHDFSYAGGVAQSIIKLDPIITGTHFVKFNEPHANFSYSASPPGSAALLEFGSTWNKFLITEEASVSVIAHNWINTPNITIIQNNFIPLGTPKNIIRIDATTVNKSNALTVAQRVYNYYLQRYKLNIRLFASTIAPGNSVLVDIQSGKQFKGIVEKMSTDLVNGYISNVEIIGVLA